MPKNIVRILDDISPSELKLRNMSRPPDGLNNMFINELGQAEKRKGYVKYNKDLIGEEKLKIVGMHRFYKQDTAQKEFIVAWNTNLYKLPDTIDDENHTPDELTNCPTLTANSDTYFVDFLNTCYIVNGANAMMKYDLENVRTVAMTVPDAPTFDSNINGSLGLGNYYFKVTYVDEDGYESNGSDASAVMASLADTSDGIKINVSVSDDDKVTKKRIYRTSVGGAIYYYDDEIANATETHSSIKADTALGTELHTNHNAPPTGAQLISKRGNRLWLGKDDDLVISQLSDVEYFPPAWFMKTGNRHKIKGMTKQLNALPIFTENSIERLIGTDEDNFEFRNAFSEKGCCAPRSLVICDNLLIYLSYDGIYYFDGTTSDIFNQRLNKYIRDNINRSLIHLSCATYFNDRYMLSYPKKPSEVPNETIVIDMKSKAMSVYSYGFSCFNKWDKGELRLFGGSNTEGQVYELETVTTDKTLPIACSDKLDPIDFGIPDRYKQFYDIYIKVKSTTGTALTFYYQFDDEDETHADLTLTPDTERWYRIRLEGGGQRARAITPKPYISDAYDVTFCGYMFIFDLEAAEYA